MDQVTVPRATVEQVLGALEGGGDSWALIGPAISALRAALEQPEPCQYPDCVDNGPEGKCTRWLLAECSKSEDYKPHRPAEPTRAQKMRDAGYTRRPTLREMAEPEQEQEPVAFDALVAISLLTHLGGEVADYEDVVEAVRRLHALNGELLEVAKLALRMGVYGGVSPSTVEDAARAAIARAEGKV